MASSTVDQHATMRDQLVAHITQMIQGKKFDTQLAISMITEAVVFLRGYNATPDAKMTLITDAFNIVVDPLPIDQGLKTNIKTLGTIMIPDLYERYSAQVDEAVGTAVDNVKQKKGCCSLL